MLLRHKEIPKEMGLMFSPILNVVNDMWIYCDKKNFDQNFYS